MSKPSAIARDSYIKDCMTSCGYKKIPKKRKKGRL